MIDAAQEDANTSGRHHTQATNLRKIVIVVADPRILCRRSSSSAVAGLDATVHSAGRVTRETE
jgi:hypothetical protein